MHAVSPITVPLPAAPSVTCCRSHVDDAHRLAAAVIEGAGPGTAIDVGCGRGEVALAVLAARPDLSVVGVDISAEACREAAERAAAVGVRARFSAVAASVFDASLPPVHDIFSNPPLLPGEPGFAASTMAGPELFWIALIRSVAARAPAFRLWVHLFDFHGIARRTGSHPALCEIAVQEGLRAEVVHRGWRAAARGSALARALPALRREFPGGEIRVDGFAVPIARLPARFERPFDVPHSIVLLSRGVSDTAPQRRTPGLEVLR